MEGVPEKLKVYEEFKLKYNVVDEAVCYIGDDYPDLGILGRVGFSVAVANARDEVKAICDYVTVNAGGSGAVREVIDKVLKGHQKLFDLVEGYMKI